MSHSSITWIICLSIWGNSIIQNDDCVHFLAVKGTYDILKYARTLTCIKALSHFQDLKQCVMSSKILVWLLLVSANFVVSSPNILKYPEEVAPGSKILSMFNFFRNIMSLFVIHCVMFILCLWYTMLCPWYIEYWVGHEVSSMARNKISPSHVFNRTSTWVYYKFTTRLAFLISAYHKQT